MAARNCICDGGSFDIRSRPFIVNVQCVVHGALGGHAVAADEYTPTVDEVRRDYAAGRDRMGLVIDLDTHADFARFLAAVERAAAVKALREAAVMLENRRGNLAYSWEMVRAEADLIESGEQA
jgi:hypothetical protein